LETAANSISSQFSTSAASVETSMTSIEMAVKALPTTESTTAATLTTTAANYARTSINAINAAERTRAASSNNNLNSFVAARTNAQMQMDTLDSIETAVTTGFRDRYTNILTTTRNLLEGKYGGDTEIDATPAIVKNVTYAYYGRACTASGVYFACSAYRYKSGMVAIYKMDVATEKVQLLQIINPSLTYLYSYFGNSLDMDGDLLVVGAYQARPTTTSYGYGMVWAFKRDSNDVYQSLGNFTQANANCKCGLNHVCCWACLPTMHTCNTARLVHMHTRPPHLHTGDPLTLPACIQMTTVATLWLSPPVALPTLVLVKTPRLAHAPSPTLEWSTSTASQPLVW
jgi:hypothetical protein